jgi:hypothetical protein
LYQYSGENGGSHQDEPPAPPQISWRTRVHTQFAIPEVT